MCLNKDPNRRPTIKHILALDVMRSALAKLQGDLTLAEQAHKPLKDIVADPIIEDEAEKVRKAKLAGARAAAAVAPPTPAPPINPFGIPGPYHVGGAQRQQLLEKAIEQNNKVPKAAPVVSPGKVAGAGPAQPIDVKREMAKLENFLDHLAKPPNEILRDALRRERETREKEREARERQVKELDAQLRLEMERESKENRQKEKERNKAAVQKQKEQMAELDRMMNLNRERIKQCQENDRLRREELKRQQEAKEKKKEQEIVQAKEVPKPKPNMAPQLQQHVVNAPLPSLQPKPKSPPPGAEVAPQKLQPFPRRPAAGAPQQPQPLQPQMGVAVLDKEKERQQVQNWANRNNDAKRREIEAAKQKKLEEDRLAVLAMDNQVYRAQQHAGVVDMKKKVLDPDLDRWVAQQERLNREKERMKAAGGKQQQDADVRKSIDAIDRVLKEHRGEVSVARKPHTPRLAANACGSPQHGNVPAMKDRPLGRYLAGAQPNPNVALFPPINPREREAEQIGMRRAYSHENPMPMPAHQPSNGRAQPPIQHHPLPAFDPDRVPLPKPRVPTPPAQDLDTIPTPFRPQPKLQNSVGGHQRSRSDVTDLERHQEEHQRLVNPSLRPLRERRVSGPGFQRLALKAEDIAIRRDASAPPVLRTPKKHVDAGALELDAVTKMEEVPTPVRQWMEPIGEGSGSGSGSSSAGMGSNIARTKPSTNNTTGSASSSPPSAGQTLTPVHSNVPKKRLPPPAVREDTPIEEDEGLGTEGSNADVGSGGFEEDSRSEPEEVVEESILEAATSQSALAARSVQYNLMRSHIASLLGSPVRASHEGPFGRPPEAQVALNAGVIFEPVTPEPRRAPASTEEDEQAAEGETDEDFEDAEAITPSQFRQVVSSNVDDDEQDEAPDETDCAVADEDVANEDIGSDADGNGSHEILDATETALFRVAALCGENFNGTQPCHTDGKPVFEGGNQTGGSTSKAEELRDYLEKEIGIGTLTAMYQGISELLTTRPPVPPAEPKNSGSGRSASTGSNQQDSTGYTVEEQIIRRVTAMVVEELGPERATEPVVDDLVSLVAQLVYLDAEVFA